MAFLPRRPRPERSGEVAAQHESARNGPGRMPCFRNRTARNVPKKTTADPAAENSAAPGAAAWGGTGLGHSTDPDARQDPGLSSGHPASDYLARPACSDDLL